MFSELSDCLNWQKIADAGQCVRMPKRGKIRALGTMDGRDYDVSEGVGVNLA